MNGVVWKGGRASALLFWFTDTIRGAEVNATLYTLVETAKANHADVRLYLQYLLEMVPLKLETGDISDKTFLDSMMPWSMEYRNYEEKQKNTEGYQKWLYYHKAGCKDFQQKDTFISWHALLMGREVWYTVGGGVWLKQWRRIWSL